MDGTGGSPGPFAHGRDQVQLTTGDNAIAERWVRTARDELFDWVIPISRRHIEMLLDEYVDHYNSKRPHRALDLLAPIDDASGQSADGPVPLDRVRRRERIGGLIHEYELAA